ncbi:hypothetical protein SAMN05444349_11872 [Bacteroides faecichinchillae]|uniref:Uncharacterized protein n=1 Tax=Bacteroides faecichinchillae TaxID=871325 RepID=A0A1M5BCY2_9BACE|nr:hypothetical protein [Bacteroides faecichinchillae]SHF40384.1 hypothetical protein SAMN05444349_11872 [Bacteroides faecichinchillae]
METFTIEDCREVARRALNLKKRLLMQEAFESVGATNFGNLKEKDYRKFIEYLKSRLPKKKIIEY